MPVVALHAELHYGWGDVEEGDYNTVLAVGSSKADNRSSSGEPEGRTLFLDGDVPSEEGGAQYCKALVSTGDMYASPVIVNFGNATGIAFDEATEAAIIKAGVEAMQAPEPETAEVQAASHESTTVSDDDESGKGVNYS